MSKLLHLPRTAVAGLALVMAAVVVLLATSGGTDDEYELRLMVPAADGVVAGTPVRIAGREVGEITDVAVKGNAAQLTVTIDDAWAPLRAGTRARIGWNSLLGRREVLLTAGPEDNAALPSGKVVEATTERVELDDIVAALDAPTRRKVRHLVADLEQTIAPNVGTLNETLRTAGPFAEAFGEVLRAVGKDGPAIRRLLTDLRQITSVLAERDTELSTTVTHLTSVLTTAAQQQDQLRTSLDQVSSTIDAGNRLFTGIPGAVDETIPLLEDLRPATDELPAVAARLKPVLRDLRPVVAELRPTLSAARTLLGHTPALLSNATPVLNDLESSLSSVQPAVSFLRPYTPEVIGFLTNWTSLFSAKNSAGHFGRAMIPVSATSFNSNPGVLPPGMTQWQEPVPGQVADQPWSDANGDEIH